MIAQCMDMNHVRAFMTLPEISRYSAEYKADLEAEEFVTNKRLCWLSYTLDNEIIGMTKFYLVTGSMGMFHPYILRKYKTKYNEMVQLFFKWVVDNIPEQICKLNVAIAENSKGAIKAAEVAGMKHEGVDRMSYLSENGPIDRILLGITRQEITLCQQ